MCGERVPKAGIETQSDWQVGDGRVLVKKALTVQRFIGRCCEGPKVLRLAGSEGSSQSIQGSGGYSAREGLNSSGSHSSET